MDVSSTWFRSGARAVASFNPNNATLGGISNALCAGIAPCDRRGEG